MPANRLAEAFVELKLDRSSYDSGITAARAAFKESLNGLDQDWLKSVRLREQAEMDLANKLSNLTMKANQASASTKAQDLEKMRSATQLLAREEAGILEFRAKQAEQDKAFAASTKAQDLEKMRQATRLLAQEEASLIQYRQLTAAQMEKIPYQNQQAGTSVRQFQQSLIQLGYGIQDFAVMLGPMGMKGAIQASINNLSMIAMSLGPVEGAIVSTAATLAAVGVTSWLTYKEAQEKASQSVDGMTKALQRQQQVLEGLSKFREANNPTGMGSTKEIASALTTESAKLLELQNKQAELIGLRGFNETKRLPVQIGEFDLTERQRREMFPTATPVEVLRHMGAEERARVEEFEARAARMAVESRAVFASEHGGSATELSGTGKALVTKTLSGKEREVIDAALSDISEKIEAGDIDIIASKTRINTILEDQLKLQRFIAEATQKSGEWGMIFEDSAEKAAAAMMETENAEVNIRKLRDKGIIDFDTAKGMLSAVDANFSNRIREIQEDESERIFQEGDAKNKAYAARTEAARKRALDLRRELKDEVEPGFKPIGDIFDKLDKRKEEIAKFKGISDEEKKDLMAGAEQSATFALDSLRKKLRPQASFSGIAEFEQKQQLSMLDSGQDEAIKKTAKFVELSNKELEKLNQKNFEGGFGP